ncbi:MAG: gliding motility-associated C-terminal domain-containing protein [Bacteroidales bacterium]|nr:gliding motility-associated C-terminal domain-containing protein [Bacteroidales bacterium]
MDQHVEEDIGRYFKGHFKRYISRPQSRVWNRIDADVRLCAYRKACRWKVRAIVISAAAAIVVATMTFFLLKGTSNEPAPTPMPLPASVVPVQDTNKMPSMTFDSRLIFVENKKVGEWSILQYTRTEHDDKFAKSFSDNRTLETSSSVLPNPDTLSLELRTERQGLPAGVTNLDNVTPLLSDPVKTPVLVLTPPELLHVDSSKTTGTPLPVTPSSPAPAKQKNEVAVNTPDPTSTARSKMPTNEISIPSAFTPNGDGKNDILMVYPAQSISHLDFRVFDKTGNPVFQTQNHTIGWDGSIKGVDAPSGNYFYTITYRNQDGIKREGKGTLVLYR